MPEDVSQRNISSLSNRSGTEAWADIAKCGSCLAKEGAADDRMQIAKGQTFFFSDRFLGGHGQSIAPSYHAE
jgi:hypothetical protein